MEGRSEGSASTLIVGGGVEELDNGSVEGTKRALLSATGRAGEDSPVSSKSKKAMIIQKHIGGKAKYRKCKPVRLEPKKGGLSL